MDLDGNRFSEPTNVDQLKRYYVWDHGHRMGAIISVSHIPCYSLLIYRPLLAHWVSHVHYSFSFLSPCSHFYTWIGALWCMHALFGSLMSLGPIGASFSLYFFLAPLYCISSHLIGQVFHSFSFILSTACFTSYSLHPEWWSSSIRYMKDSHIIFAIYPTETDSEILSLRRSSHQREFLRVCLLIVDIIFGAYLFMFRVCAFVYM